ncbi:MAG: hypothetical protein CMF38_02705 [Legionellaceae bacterium]|nr:hypothetical protein [Legionellaceae bacterium]HAF87257.1 hypothetical protein [Legionellales bacterium]HCA90107.1 hypothetical protein [Legionellales bacterium]|tara:strand:- start:218 stop:475 length:258 start_codon:yes stop_codon:yes gene_type:complete
MRPEDIISDTQNEIMLNGVTVRKGTVGAFLANIDTLENSSSSVQEKEIAQSILEELAPAIKATGLLKHMTFKNQQIAAMFEKSMA